MSELKYNVGDRVKYDSEICTVTKVLESQGKFKYRVQSDTWFDVVEDEMIEGLVEEEVGLVDNLSSRWVNEFNLPEGYQFVDENGNIINATKIVLEKKTVEEKYSDVKIQTFGNVVILKGGINADNPTEYMNEVVHYILNLLGKPKYNQFIEDYLDNPWVRILIFDFNSMEFNNSFDDIVTNFKRQ